MKIFGKRKRTVVDPETAEKFRKEQDEQKKIDADKAVQELLKLDPSELNSKQRRLVKRYKERHGAESEEKLSSFEQSTAAEESKTAAAIETPSTKTASITQEAEESSSDSSSSDSSDSDSSDESDGEDETSAKDAKNDTTSGVDGNETTMTLPALPSKPTPRPEGIDPFRSVASAGPEPKEGNEAGDIGKKSNDLDEEEVKKLLEKLNSKQRRKLMRRLEREGNGILSEVHGEALKLLHEASDAEKSAPTDTPEPSKDTKAATTKTSGKKRKKDWSDLPPEERLRREEQRRMQQEAAERRLKEGPNASKRHPLNSERRRANRRKPKWESKGPRIENEHNTSGYHMRKLKKAGVV